MPDLFNEIKASLRERPRRIGEDGREFLFLPEVRTSLAVRYFQRDGTLGPRTPVSWLYLRESVASACQEVPEDAG